MAFNRNKKAVPEPAAPGAVDQELQQAPVLTETTKWGFPEYFIISQTALPALLFLPGTQAFRMPIRVASFGISLLALFWWLNKRDRRHSFHPSAPYLLAAFGYLCLMIFHPSTNGVKAGIAQTLLYLAVFAPAFWAAGSIQTPGRLRRMLWILLFCNGINSMVGILQAYDPATYMPREFSKVVTGGMYGLGNLTYVGASGKAMVRPPGLFDTPGAVCGPGMFAAFFGLVLAMEERSWLKKAIAMGFSFAGISAIYLTLVRTNLLVLGGMILVFAILQQFQQSKAKSFVVIGLAIGLAVGGFTLATVFGGKAISDRLDSLGQKKASDVYMDSRGIMVQEAFYDLLPEYPLGAGLGRWGMMAFYFGNNDDPDAPTLWAEVQFPAWILDGGIVLLGLYCMALFVAMKEEFKISRTAPSYFTRLLSSAVLSGNAGIAALCFSFVPFCAQSGLQFWFLSGALHGVMEAERWLVIAMSKSKPAPAVETLPWKARRHK